MQMSWYYIIFLSVKEGICRPPTGHSGANVSPTLADLLIRFHDINTMAEIKIDENNIKEIKIEELRG